jgi:hypothetical protein
MSLHNPTSEQRVRDDFYKVALEPGHHGCDSCGAGAMWTIVFLELTGEAPEEVAIGTSWGDEEMAKDVCDLMNMAYDKGCEKP